MVQLCGENVRIVKRIYVGKFAGSRSLGRPWKRWFDNMKDFKKRGMNVSQVRRMVGVYEREYMGCSLGDEPLILLRLGH